MWKYRRRVNGQEFELLFSIEEEMNGRVTADVITCNAAPIQCRDENDEEMDLEEVMLVGIPEDRHSWMRSQLQVAMNSNQSFPEFDPTDPFGRG